MSPRISPSPTLSDSPSTATTPPNRLVSPRVSTMAAPLMEELPRAELGAVDELVLDERALRGQVGNPGRAVLPPRLARQQAAVEHGDVGGESPRHRDVFRAVQERVDGAL